MADSTVKSSSETWDVQIKRAMNDQASDTTQASTPATDGRNDGGPLSLFPRATAAADQYAAAHPAQDLPGPIETLLWRAQPLMIGLAFILIAILLLVGFARYWPALRARAVAFFDDLRTPPRM
jgi:hypothetical protein